MRRMAIALALAGAALLVAGVGVALGQWAPWQDGGWDSLGAGYSLLVLLIAPAALVLTLVLAGSLHVVGGRTLFGGSLFLVAIPVCLCLAFVLFYPNEHFPLVASLLAGFLLLCAATTTWFGYRRFGPRSDEHQIHPALASAERCYKSGDTEDPVVYVQEQGQWGIYAGGKLIGKSRGTIPAPMLTPREEITQEQAENLIELGRAKAERKKESRATLLKARLRFAAGLVLALGISVGGGYFANRYDPRVYSRALLPYLVVVVAGLAAALVSLLVWHPRLKDLRHIIIPWAIAWVVVTLMMWAVTFLFMRQPNPWSG